MGENKVIGSLCLRAPFRSQHLVGCCFVKPKTESVFSRLLEAKSSVEKSLDVLDIVPLRPQFHIDHRRNRKRQQASFLQLSGFARDGGLGRTV